MNPSDGSVNADSVQTFDACLITHVRSSPKPGQPGQLGYSESGDGQGYRETGKRGPLLTVPVSLKAAQRAPAAEKQRLNHEPKQPGFLVTQPRPRLLEPNTHHPAHQHTTTTTHHAIKVQG